MLQWTVDAFAGRAFQGNPACVVEPMTAWPSAAWMQGLAAENNQAETAFLLKTASLDRFGLRWFTPTKEVDLCGHATLASGHVLLDELALAFEDITFDTRSGPLRVRRAQAGYEMNLPADPPSAIPCPDGLAEVLGVRPVEVFSARYLVAILEDAKAVRDIRPDLGALATIAGAQNGGRGSICVAAPAGPADGCDVVDRFFAPGEGIPEDPATGSAHCILSPLYAARLGRPRVSFFQAYPGRGAEIVTELEADRVRLFGGAVTVIEARLRLQPQG
jgi:PhzF family phenazine biosynthesis protein